MCKYFHFFKGNPYVTALMLPFPLKSVINDWCNLRKLMARQIPAAFTRDEWAYMLMFLDQENLMRPFYHSFGQPIDKKEEGLKMLIKPRGHVALWLPNNVSLLGPLMMILISLTGNSMRMKSGTRSENLAGIFRDYVLSSLNDGTLKNYLKSNTMIDSFDREDNRNHEMARTANLRIAFSSDEASQAIESMPHQIGSIGFYFNDKRSEAWVEYGAINEQTVDTIIKVFSIYGQAGCTSPRRVVIIDGNYDEAMDLKRRILKQWPKKSMRTPLHTASENVMAQQWASALGWDAELADKNSAVIAVGDENMPNFSSYMSLPIVWSRLESALNALPSNIQTIGYAVLNPDNPKWLNSIGNSNIKRFVPVDNMHHFGPVWDGYGFWRQFFEEIEVVL